uniref:Uncharacterized protein n=1 Tax=Globisporangium ultimum (strain ATCC 200006 / CBS 805.95 / DAOM BR144) TaxID=431595 RepID=K3WSC5_GLOUD
MSEKAASAVPDLDKAIQLLKAKQNAYYIQSVKDAMQAEQLRKYKLTKAVTHVESSRLEKKFAKERKRDRERLQQIQEDHMALLNAKIAEWKVHGVKLPSGDHATFTANSTDEQRENGAPAAPLQPPQLKKSPLKKVSKETLNRLATPRVTVAKVTDAVAASRNHGETSQDVAFYQDLYRKHDKARLHRAFSLPALNAKNLRALTETDLLHKKMQLLQQLHGVVSQQQECIIQDDQCTVRSSVSSWKSSDFTKSTKA